MRKTFLLVSLIAFFYSCKKDIQNGFILYTNLGINDTVWVNKPMSTHVADSVSNAINNTTFFVDTFDANKGRIIKLNDSLEVAIQPNSCFNPDNSMPTSGNIRIEVLDLRKKGDYIKYLLPTTSNKYLLENEGTFYVSLSQNNHEILLKPGSYLKLKWIDATPVQYMKFFELYSLRSLDSLYTWMQGNDGNIAVWDSTSLGVNKRGYEMVSGSTGWLGCSLFTDTLQQRTRLNVTLPPNYTNKNTFVFASFKNTRTIVRLSPDFNSRSFYALNVPVNSTVTLLSISLIDKHYYWSRTDVTVTNANRFSLSPEKLGVTNLINNLDNLQ